MDNNQANFKQSLTIRTYLKEIEDDHGVEILFAVESGSRVWGFESPDSDYDVRFVYKRPPSWYLSIQERRDVLEPKHPHPYDINGWDLKKALFQIYRGNPAFSEWLMSSHEYMGGPARDELRALAVKYFNPRSAIYHYLHMANGNFRTYLKEEEVILKKYLYVIRPLAACNYISIHQSIPPIGLTEMMGKASLGEDFPAEEFLSLLEQKRSGAELGKAPRIDALNRWIEVKLAAYADLARTTAKGSLFPDDLNDYFFETVKGHF